MRFPTRSLLLAAAAALAPAVLLAVGPGRPSAVAASQAREPRERALWVSVVDEKGATVGDLSPDDFIIREDGLRREALRVEKATEPIDLTLLVDTSQAMTPHMQFARDALKDLVTAMAPHGSIAIVSFGERPTIVAQRTRTLAELTRGVNRLFALDGAGAYLLDAVAEVCNGLRIRQPARAIIAVVVTDGVEFTDLNADAVLSRLVETGARLDVFNVAGPLSAALADQAAHERARLIDEGTRRSGGDHAHLITNMALRPRLALYAAELINQYRVVYARPESLIPPSRVEVSVDRPGLAVRATPVPAPRG